MIPRNHAQTCGKATDSEDKTVKLVDNERKGIVASTFSLFLRTRC